MNFSDAFASASLNADIKYDLKILDKTGKVILQKENLVARNATDTQIISFPANEIYQIEVNIKGLMKPGQAAPDVTRNGVARGIVVVPEFPSTTIITISIIGGLVAVLISIQRIDVRIREK